MSAIISIKNFIHLLLCFLLITNTSAQENTYKTHYIGILPSVLLEPYDTLNALEVNIVPFVYEYKIREDIGLQFRTIVNYRFLETKAGISQTGGTVLLNKYFHSLVKPGFWLTPELAVFYTYAYNQLDEIQTMTLGIEPGCFMEISNAFSLSLNAQPGINYYPDEFSQQFVGTKSGFKSHFGIIFHFGFHF